MGPTRKAGTTKRKKTAPDKGSSRAGKASFRSKDHKKIEEELLERRRGIVEQMNGVHLSPNGSDSTEPGDLGDWASASAEMDIAASILESETGELRAIDAALHRIREGSYGVCEDCEKTIPSVRLKAMPYATLCVECKMEREKERPRGRGAQRWRPATFRTAPTADTGDFDEDEEGE